MSPSHTPRPPRRTTGSLNCWASRCATRRRDRDSSRGCCLSGTAISKPSKRPDRVLIGKFVGKRGSALHHIALEVEDIHEYLRRLSSLGVRLIDEHPRPGGMGTMIAFIHPREFDGLLVELVETRR